jgi:ElaB/YqjD/DUF883 family membrane-anchored ribosome-binding protein
MKRVSMSETHVASTDKSGAGEGFNRDVRRLGRYVGQLHDDLAGIAKGTGEAAQSGVAAAREGGKRALEDTKRKGEEAAASLRHRMADHPGATLGIAVGFGVLIGLVGSAMIHSKRS